MSTFLSIVVTESGSYIYAQTVDVWNRINDDVIPKKVAEAVLQNITSVKLWSLRFHLVTENIENKILDMATWSDTLDHNGIIYSTLEDKTN